MGSCLLENAYYNYFGLKEAVCYTKSSIFQQNWNPPGQCMPKPQTAPTLNPSVGYCSLHSAISCPAFQVFSSEAALMPCVCVCECVKCY